MESLYREQKQSITAGGGLWILLSVGISTFMSALDSSIVNIILPVINRVFRGTVAETEWVVTIYLLVVSGILLMFGRLGDMRGYKPIYLTGLVVFVAGSALCGLSGSNWELVGFRGLQAIGAAMLFANAPAILTRSFPPQRRGTVLGLQATMTYLGLTAGPSLGGWLAHAVSWRAVFYVNVPVGAAAFLMGLRFIRPIPSGERNQRFDIPGAALFLLALTALLLALNQGHAWGWASPAILGLFGAFVLLLAAFIFAEKRAAQPMLDLGLFRTWTFSAAAVSAILNYICVFSVTFLLPFYLIQGRRLAPDHVGLLLSAQPLVMAIVAPLAGALSDRIGARIPSTAGMLILAAGLWLLSRLGPYSSVGAEILGLVVVGFGTGLFIAPNNNALMGAAPRERQGIAAGVLATARNTGMVLGIGLAGAVFTTILARGGPDAFYRAVSAGLLAAAVIGAIGAFTSAARGGHKLVH